MRRHNRMLYRAARSILKDEQEAEDAVQEAYLRAYRTIGQFRGEARLSTWLVRIVLNEALARSRTRSRRLKLAIRLDYDVEEAQRWPEAPEESAQRAQARRLLQTKIDALPDLLRTVFTLRALNEMSVEEVAAALDIPRTLVSLRYFRARRLLRAALAGTDGVTLATLYPFAGSRCAGIVARVLVAASLRCVA